MLLRQLPENPDVQFAEKSVIDGEGYELTLGLVAYQTVERHQAELPVVILKPDKTVRRTKVTRTAGAVPSAGLNT